MSTEPTAGERFETYLKKLPAGLPFADAQSAAFELACADIDRLERVLSEIANLDTEKLWPEERGGIMQTMAREALEGETP